MLHPPAMQANYARINNTSFAEVGELTEVLGKIFVNLWVLRYTSKG